MLVVVHQLRLLLRNFLYHKLAAKKKVPRSELNIEDEDSSLDSILHFDSDLTQTLSQQGMLATILFHSVSIVHNSLCIRRGYRKA